MGALPKNKITRVERGKRRRGNSPSLIQDTNTTSIPLHKRGMVADFMKLMGISSSKDTAAKKAAAPKAEKSAKKTAKKAAPAKTKITAIENQKTAKSAKTAQTKAVSSNRTTNK